MNRLDYIGPIDIWWVLFSCPRKNDGD